MIALVALPAAGDERFRITYERDDRQETSIVLTGTVVNESRRDVVDVYVKAEALGVSGKVVATGIAFASSFLPGHGSATFVAKVPRVEGVRAFRVSVSSFREGSGSQAP
jgi:hypothetical protein